MKKLSLTVLVWVAIAVENFGQNTSLSFDQNQWNEHIGIIALPSTGQPIGSGFVFGSHNDVVTCAHVWEAAESCHETNLLYYVHLGTVRQLKLKYILPKYDLAVFSPTPEINGSAKKCGDFKKMRPGDQIIYIGYDTRQSNAGTPTCVANGAIVTATGSALNDGTIVDFLEFEGAGIPGYSGGPVFNQNGELIAIMREAWTKKGVKGGSEILINRAFSLDILSILDNQIFLTENLRTNVDTATLLDFLNVPQVSNLKTNSAAK